MKRWQCLLVFALCALSAGASLVAQTQVVDCLGSRNDDLAYSTAQTVDGGYLLAGFSNSFSDSGTAVMAARLDYAGQLVWSTLWDGAADDMSSSLLLKVADGFVVVGFTASFGGGRQDALIISYNPAGTQQWSRVYGGDSADFCADIAYAATGSGYVTVGSSASFGPTTDCQMAHFTDTGNLIWFRTYDGSGYDKAVAVTGTAESTYGLTGFTDSDGAGRGDILVTMLDIDGVPIWSLAVGGEQRDDASEIVYSFGEGFLVAGYTASFGAGAYDAFVIRFDLSGNVIWARTLGTAGTDYALGVQKSADGGCYMCGATEDLGGNYRPFVAKFTAAGAFQWARAVGDNATGEAWDILQTLDDGFALAGTITSHGAGSIDMLLAKFDAAGNTCLLDTLDLEAAEVNPIVTPIELVVAQVTPAITVPQPTLSTPQPQLTMLCRMICGDADGNGIVNISDAVYLISYIFGGGPPPDPLVSGDADCNGIVNISDAVYLISYIFGGGPAPCSECP